MTAELRSPRTILFLSVVCFAAAGSMAQSQSHLASLRDGKLGLPFLKHVDWVHGLAEAKVRASKSGKPIFAYFTRSDERCPDSISVECGVLVEDGFIEFSRSVVPFCHITTGVKTDPDQDLFKVLGGRSYPRLLFMDAAGRVTYVVRGEKLADIRRGFTELTELAALKKRVSEGDRKAKFPLLKKRLELRDIDFPAAEKEMRRIPRITTAQKRELAPLLLVSEILHLVSRTGDKKKDRTKTGEKFARMKKRGRIPTGDGILPFWLHILEYAEARKDSELFEEALDTLKQEFPHMDLSAESKTLRALKSGLRRLHPTFSIPIFSQAS